MRPWALLAATATALVLASGSVGGPGGLGPGRGHGSEATCTAAQKTKRAQAAAAYRKRMAKDRAAYFRTHASPRLRAAYVKRQQAKLAALEKAARCRVVKAPSTPAAGEGPLAAGTYTGAAFRPRLTFSVGAGWSLFFDSTATSLLLGQKRDPGGQTIALDSFGGARTVEERVAALRNVPGLTAEPAVATQVAGFDGQRFDALTTASELVLLPGLADRYELEPNDRVRVMVIDVRGHTVTIVVEASAGDWAIFRPAAEAVLATLRFPA